MQNEVKYINEKKHAEMTGRSVQTLRNDRHLGRGVPYRKVGRRVLYRLDEVIDYMERRKVQTNN